MLEYVIEGHDGAAKTPVTLGVKKRLEELEYKVEICAPFQTANNIIPEPDIYMYWKNEDKAKEALTILSGIVDESRTRAKERNVDIILYDRHWMTIIGEIYQRPGLEELWQDFLPTFFLEAPVEKTLDCKRLSFDVPWTSSVERISQENHKYLNLAKVYTDHVVGHYVVKTRDQPLEPIVDSITNKILEDLK